MKFGRRKICFCIVLVYVIFSLYAAYNVFFNTKAISRVHRVVKKITVADSAKGLGVQPRSAAVPSRGEGWNPWEEDKRAESVSVLQRRQEFRAHQARIAKDRPRRHKVQIWGKAAIGLYLWEHILEGPLNPADRKAQWREGEVQSGAITFSFYTGPAVVQGQIPLDTDSVVLVLNGREEQKIAYATRWLEHAGALVRTRALARVAVVMLGSERCANDWLRPYLRAHGGFVDLLFLVYDSPWVNERDVLQWPLGVATYRDFPVVPPSVEMVTSQRPYLCNFLGTVYRNSSREKLMEILKKHGLEGECVVAAREQWVPTETAESLRRYRAALAQSDLTLCPVGVNPECYRVYEACSYGSVPVVEDVGTAGGCAGGAGGGSPLRLLKASGAPFLFLRDWAELPALLERERRMTPEEKAERRRRLLEWYGTFRMRMRDRFTQALEETFFRTG
ncbi:ribitol-5-phosphate xylosyltransferase 1 [Anguilla anguilla]|uniref:ribitol-5-phosphate xylosyltransferase 1 n=1 Tax=Anguilla anguilla TaxID=7936 RepID=UPI0015AEF524|nr:ribitol-5-phosphate xylosyltransferase 1 [Anguilla anguilla]